MLEQHAGITRRRRTGVFVLGLVAVFAGAVAVAAEAAVAPIANREVSPLVTVAPDQTLRVTESNPTTTSCPSTLAVKDVSGQVTAARTVRIAPGATAQLDFRPAAENLDAVAPMFRALVSYPPDPCRRLLGSVQLVNTDGSTAQVLMFGPSPVGRATFGAVGVRPGQTLQVNVVDESRRPCTVPVRFLDAQGNRLASNTLTLSPGAGAGASYQLPAVQDAATVQIRPDFPPDPCRTVADLEILDSAGRATVVIPELMPPPDPDREVADP